MPAAAAGFVNDVFACPFHRCSELWFGESVTDDQTVCAGAGASSCISLYKGNSQLRKTDRRSSAYRAAGHGRSQFAGNVRLLRARSHGCGYDVAVVERESRAGLILVVGSVNVYQQIKDLRAVGEERHFGGITN